MVLYLLAGVVVFYLCIVAYAYFMQKNMVYFPSRVVDYSPQDLGFRYEDIMLTSGNGVAINGWFIPVENPRATLLFFHGNGGNISDRLDAIRQFHELNLNILIIDYQGYGKSEGTPSEKGTYDDAMAAWGYLTGEKSVKPEDIVIFGRSLGGAVAVDLAARVTPRALIVESAFTSIPDIAAKLYPFLPVRLLSRYKYDSAAKIRTINVPKLIIHSPEDDIVPYNFGWRLYEVAAEPKQFYELTGSHNEGYIVNEAAYKRAIDTFLAQFEDRDREQ